MNSDLANLLGALRDRPDDELARLALADWCLEQPDEATQARAEHVRLSLELARLPRGPSARPLFERVKAMERRWRTPWLGRLREIAHRCDFLPGGLVKLEASGGRTEQAIRANVAPPADEEFAWVSSLVARAISPGCLRWLAGLLPGGLVRSFQLEMTSGVDLVGVLPACPWLPGVRALDVSSFTSSDSGRLADDVVVRLARLESLGELRELRLYNAALHPAGCTALVGSPHLRRLRRLALPRCNLSAAMPGLCSGSFASLGVLCVESNDLSPPAVETLAGWPGLATVRQLDLSENPLGDAGLAALARSPHLGELRELGLRNCGLTHRGLTALAGASLGRLRSLDVRQNDSIADAGLLAISGSPLLSSLRVLLHTRYGLRDRTRAALEARFGKGHGPSPH
jgi:uncharacterized protein (TIGR02996 family)